LKYILLMIIFLLLPGCADVVMTGAQTVLNRHTIQKNVHDQYLTMKVFRAIKIDNDQFKDTNISIATYNNEVLLTGQVPETWQREEAARLAEAVPDVGQVYNLITVSNPSSSLTRISDAWLTAKVKAKLMASNDVDGSHIKVVTEHGTVYLMGVLQPNEAAAAVDVARNTDGVESVIKVFSYMRISKR